MNPLIASALIGAGGNLVGSFGGSSSRREAEGRHFALRNKRNDLRSLLGSNNVSWGGPGWKDRSPSIYGGKGIDLLGRDRDLDYSGKHLQQVFDVGAKQGLTPQEIAGSPAAGGTSRSGGNATLGQSNAAASQTAATLHNAAADRASNERIASMRSRTELAVAGMQSGTNIIGQQTQAKTQRRGQDVQTQVANIAAEAGKYNARQIANATKAAAAMSASATKYASDNNLKAASLTSARQRLNVLDQLAQKKLVDAAQIDEISAQTALLLQDAGIKSVVHSERWARLFSGMSAENVSASAIAALNGVPLEQVLKGQNMNDAQRKALRSFLDEVLSRQSRANIETEGINSILTDAFYDLLGKSR